MLEHWMKRSNVNRKPFQLFSCRWQLEKHHVEPVNGLSIGNSLMVSGSDDGTIVLHDLYQTFADQIKFTKYGLDDGDAPESSAYTNGGDSTPSGDHPTFDSTPSSFPPIKKTSANDQHMQDNSPITLARISQPHKRRMVTSIALTHNYQDDMMMIPTGGLYVPRYKFFFFFLVLFRFCVLYHKFIKDVIREALRKKLYERKGAAPGV
ncbi:hypothetical protein RFI_04991 [Reticulomyxa filosa]|uniref:Uncharacterized protein n=1 Tax=Reticulomyxa filosa TaxID=46433 RepID=X6P3H7_RETFI|nr:hypothetical protein RFI_04991 [Reticulomyxa filosa]|eukprot:ETO32122.1 hypothetical protein RFI_04991 [Reticulomyxa filosa]